MDDVVNEDFPPSANTVDALEKLLPEVNRSQEYANISPQARVASKLVTRSDTLKDMMASREADTQHFCSFICQDTVQKNLKRYVEALKKKKNKSMIFIWGIFICGMRGSVITLNIK